MGHKIDNHCGRCCPWSMVHCIDLNITLSSNRPLKYEEEGTVFYSERAPPGLQALIERCEGRCHAFNNRDHGGFVQVKELTVHNRATLKDCIYLFILIILILILIVL